MNLENTFSNEESHIARLRGTTNLLNPQTTETSI